MLDVVEPGVQTLVQDAGRPGYLAIGLPPSGPMDHFSHHVANALVGNDPAAAALESVFTGPTLHVQRDTVIAVTGAQIDLRIDGVSMPTWTTLPVRAGQIVAVGPALNGARSYLAVRGGIGTPKVMGSRSTYLPSGIGGMAGRQLRAGDDLKCGNDFGPHPRLGYSVDEAIRPAPAEHREIRVVLGLCRYRFTDVSVDKMLSSDFTIGVEANRVGYRLSGPPLEFVDRAAPFGAGDDPSNVVDLGYPVGSIQVPSGQELICLLRDGVTGGGYATIGTVIGVDIDVLAQMQAPNTVRLVEVDIDDAVAARRARDATIAAVYRSATAS
jgi:biotin-dependent carboxylase-like uncharacterized protein